MLLHLYLSFMAAALPLSTSAEPSEHANLSPPAAMMKAPLPAEPLPSLFTVGDYPPLAEKNHWEGDVVADLTIDREGHVSNCAIFQSSGHEVLDEKTCEVIKGRARFAPAQGSNGHAVEGKFRTRPIAWRMD